MAQVNEPQDIFQRGYLKIQEGFGPRPLTADDAPAVRERNDELVKNANLACFDHHAVTIDADNGAQRRSVVGPWLNAHFEHKFEFVGDERPNALRKGQEFLLTGTLVDDYYGRPFTFIVTKTSEEFDEVSNTRRLSGLCDYQGTIWRVTVKSHCKRHDLDSFRLAAYQPLVGETLVKKEPCTREYWLLDSRGLNTCKWMFDFDVQPEFAELSRAAQRPQSVRFFRDGGFRHGHVQYTFGTIELDGQTWDATIRICPSEPLQNKLILAPAGQVVHLEHAEPEHLEPEPVAE